ncbi:hypothetical protein [Neomesorhizobium albiziae]|uniref:hypothetical protein n=1 Tax=Neomesorhizobium albiziae TaxID=335020 RepID=UPI00122C2ED4|nr:hypothetical protein [Mesorhizobium albiziae]GLS29930.1 hypothetical protein GCM10007937_16380 [Mesorhizobium albiziae]
MAKQPDIETIRERFAAAVTASARSVADIESAAGMKRDGLRDFLAHRKHRLSLSDAAALAVELGTSLEWLAGMSRAKVEI